MLKLNLSRISLLLIIDVTFSCAYRLWIKYNEWIFQIFLLSFHLSIHLCIYLFIFFF